MEDTFVENVTVKTESDCLDTDYTETVKPGMGLCFVPVKEAPSCEDFPMKHQDLRQAISKSYEINIEAIKNTDLIIKDEIKQEFDWDFIENDELDQSINLGDEKISSIADTDCLDTDYTETVKPGMDLCFVPVKEEPSREDFPMKHQDLGEAISKSYEINIEAIKNPDLIIKDEIKQEFDWDFIENDELDQSINLGDEKISSIAGSSKPKLKTTELKCSKCSYKTFYKCNLNDHLIAHKPASEIPDIQCQICAYKTKRKRNFKAHMAVHERSPNFKRKKPGERTMHKCEQCGYETHKRQRFDVHLLKHKSIDELEVSFDCDQCPYRAKKKGYLTKHIRMIHTSVEEQVQYKCEECSFTTIHKSSLKAHGLNHKPLDQVVTYNCTICTYRTPRKGDLNSHFLSHSLSGGYSCNDCEFKSSQKRAFDIHVIHFHTDPDKILRCHYDNCDFVTLHKESIRVHKFSHQNPEDIKNYCCPDCSYKSPRKENLKLHILKHKKVGEVQSFSCEFCHFVTKYRNNIIRHKKKFHKNEIPVTKETKQTSINEEILNFKNALQNVISINDVNFDGRGNLSQNDEAVNIVQEAN